MNNQNEKNKNELSIELSEEIAEGNYINLTIITHSSSEFVIDFVNVLPGMPKCKVKSRIICTPSNLKKIIGAMQDNLLKYEEKFGKITELENLEIPFNFGGPIAQA